MVHQRSNWSLVRGRVKRKQWKINLTPLLIGMLTGTLMLRIFEMVSNTKCYYEDVKDYERYVLKTTRHSTPNAEILKEYSAVKSKPTSEVPGKSTYSFRPLHVSDEIETKDLMLVGIITTVERLERARLLIKHTWADVGQQRMFFIPRTKDGFPRNHSEAPDVVQFIDTDHPITYEKLFLSMLKIYGARYKWFVVVSDDTYLNTGALIELLHTVDASASIALGDANALMMSMKRENFMEKSSRNDESFDRFKIRSFIAVSYGLMKNLHTTSPDEFARNMKESTAQLGLNGRFVTDLRSLRAINSQLHNFFSIHPIHSASSMIEVHREFLRQRLKINSEAISNHQLILTNINNLLPDSPEKTVHWPIGYQSPSKPTSRFEVIPWTYFDKEQLYGLSDVTPVSPYSDAYKLDTEHIMGVIRESLKRDENISDFDIVKGYRRFDPLRGAEYIVDVIGYGSGSSVRRFNLLRPLVGVEVQEQTIRDIVGDSYPTDNEKDESIYVVVSVFVHDMVSYSEFLQWFEEQYLKNNKKRDITLLSVFVLKEEMTPGEEKYKLNEEDDDENDQEENIETAMQSLFDLHLTYGKSNLPFIRLMMTTQYISTATVMDGISMHLPEQSIVFLTTPDIRFDKTFLTRCRRNVVRVRRLFSPVPFQKYDHRLIHTNTGHKHNGENKRYSGHLTPIHSRNGFWNTEVESLACFRYSDYIGIRNENIRKDGDEGGKNKSNFNDKSVYQVFVESELEVFRALDHGLRSTWRSHRCRWLKELDVESYEDCIVRASVRRAGRSDLAKILLQKGGNHEDVF